MVSIYELTRCLAVAALCCLVLYKCTPELPEKHSSIYEVASRELIYVGRYDERTTISVKYWIYAILAAFYTEDAENVTYDPYLWLSLSNDPLSESGFDNTQQNVMYCISKWLQEDVYDPNGYIALGVKSASENIFNEISDAKENKRPVTFKVSPDYDYHCVTKSVEYNDFINYKSLLDRLKVLEVNK